MNHHIDGAMVFLFGWVVGLLLCGLVVLLGELFFDKDKKP